MPRRISPTSRTFGCWGRTCPIQIPGQRPLTALKCAHALLLADYECIEWGPAAGPASIDTLMAIAGPAHTQNLTAGGTRPSKPPALLLSLFLPPLSMLFESSQGKGRHNSSSEAQQHDGDRPPADLNQNHCAPHAVLERLSIRARSCRARTERRTLEDSECAADPSSSKR